MQAMLSRDALRSLCVELQCAGIRFPDDMPGRAGGAGPAEGCFILIEDVCLSVPVRSWFVAESPFSAVPDAHGAFVLQRSGHVLCGLQTLPPPELCRHYTAAGTAYGKIALLHGRDCLASTVYQDCCFRRTGDQCRFCGIGLSLAGGSTVLYKEPSELAEVARHVALNAQAGHVTLTCGCREDERAAVAHLAECVRMIKQHAGLPVHVQICPPAHSDMLETLHTAGADTIGIHIETFCMQTLLRVAPAKADCGLERYRAAWHQAVDLFGANQVSSFLIAGLGELPESLLEGARELAGMGVVPYLLPLRPVPGTPLERSRPPDAAVMERLYRAVAEVMQVCGLSSSASRAGCVRCGACSCLRLFEEEAV